MEKTQKLITVGILLVLGVGINAVFINPLQEAFAIDSRSFAVNNCSTSSNLNTSFYEPVNNYFITTVGSCNSSTASVLPLTIVNASSGVILHNYTIASLHGSTTAPTKGAIAGSVFALWCNSLYCFDIWDTGGTTRQIQKWVIASGSPASYFNETALNTAGSFLTDGLWCNGGTDNASLGTCYAIQTKTSNSHRVLVPFGQGCHACNSGADLPIQELTNELDLGLTSVNTGQIDGCINCGSAVGTQRIGIEGRTSAGNFVITVVNIQTTAIVCQSSLSSLTTTNGGAFKYAGNTLNKWMLTDQTQVYFLNLDACSISTTVTASALGTTGATILSVGINPNINQYYVYAFVSGSQPFVSIMNSSSLSQKITVYYSILASTGLGGHFQQMAVGITPNAVLLLDAGKTGIIYYINGIPSSGGGTNPSNPGGGSQTNGKCDPNTTALQCVGKRTALNAITGSPKLTDTVAQLGNGLGIINSTNTDPKTNGSGLFLMVGVFVFFTSAIIGSIAIANARFNAGIGYADVLTKEVWLFLVVGVISLSWYLGWIPDIVFYGMIIGLVGLFTFGIYRHVKPGG